MKTPSWTKFKDVAVCERFNCNGMQCIKKSSRTAWIDLNKKQWFTSVRMKQ